MNGVGKYIVLAVIFVTMISCFWLKCSEGGWACMALFVLIWSIRNPLRELNYKTGVASFESLKLAEMFIESPDWLKHSLDIKHIEQYQVDTYKNLRLQRKVQLTSPFNVFHKKTVNTINEYKKYIDIGYYPATTIDSIEASNYEILTLLLNLIENAKDIKNIDTLDKIVPKLPAREICYMTEIDPSDEYEDKNIAEYLKDFNISTKIEPKRYSIEICFENNSKEFISFTELLRADFYNKGCDDILVEKYYHSAGTFQISEPMILSKIGGTYHSLPLEYKQSFKSKFIKFTIKSKLMRPLYKLICLFVKDNVDRNEFSKFGD